MLVNRPDLIKGSITDFVRGGLDDKNMYEVASENVMHPLLTLNIELAWLTIPKHFGIPTEAITIIILSI